MSVNLQIEPAVRRWFLVLMAVVCLQLSGGIEARQSTSQETGMEFIRIEIEFHNDTIGLIWAYRCENCLPKRLIFDRRRLLVHKPGDQTEEYSLEDVQGKAAVVTWVENTSQTVRVMPLQ